MQKIRLTELKARDLNHLALADLESLALAYERTDGGGWRLEKTTFKELLARYNELKHSDFPGGE